MASIEKTTTKRGRTQWRVRYRDPSRRSRERTFRRKVEADRFAAEVETDMARGQYIDPSAGRITLGEWIADWDAARTGLRPTTVVRDESCFRNHILPAFGDRRLSTIRPVEVRGWVSRLIDKGLAPGTVKKVVQLLAAALKAAVRDGLIPASPAAHVDLPRVERREMRFLSVEEIDTLATAIGPDYEALVYAAAYTGLRFGELAGLRVDRLNLLRRHLLVDQSATEVRGEFIVGPVKTPRSRRTVALPTTLVEVLARHLETTPPDGWVFGSPSGGPLRRNNFRRRVWLPAVAASVGQPMRFHDLRHTHAALLIEAGEHPKVIQERLGHASIVTTLDTYGHLYEGRDERAAEALNVMIGQSRQGTPVTGARNR